MTFTKEEKEAIYKVIFARRDVRGNLFKPDKIPEETLEKILMAGHHAPSVGYSQPWDFIIIDKQEIKSKIKQAFIEAHKKEADTFDKEKRKRYLTFRLEGIEEAPIGVVVTCDRNRHGPAIIGKSANMIMDLYSCVCAIQNIWLAARAENIGVGWVSIINHDEIKKILNIPDDIEVVAYLCMGYVKEFLPKPELEEANWLKRIKLEDIIHYNGW